MITQRVIDVFAGIGMAALLILAVVIGATLVSEWRLTRRRAYLEERACSSWRAARMVEVVQRGRAHEPPLR